MPDVMVAMWSIEKKETASQMPITPLHRMDSHDVGLLSSSDKTILSKANMTRILLLEAIQATLKRDACRQEGSPSQCDEEAVAVFVSILHEELIRTTSAREKPTQGPRLRVRRGIHAVLGANGDRLRGLQGAASKEKSLLKLFGDLRKLAAQPQMAHDEVIVQLMVLSEYLSLNLATPSLLQKNADVLLSIFNDAIRTPLHSSKSTPVRMMHALLEVYDEMAAHGGTGHQVDSFVSMFLEDAQHLEWFQGYTKMVLLDDDMVATLQRSGIPSDILRNRILKHWGICVEAVEKILPHKAGQTVSSRKKMLLQRIFFLIDPEGGILLPYLKSETVQSTAGFGLRTEALRVLERLFGIKDSPFVRQPELINTYVVYHIGCFLRNMREKALEKRDMAAQDSCSHLRILLAFSENKDAQVAEKFSKLDFFSFLMKQLDLEHESTAAYDNNDMQLGAWCTDQGALDDEDTVDQFWASLTTPQVHQSFWPSGPSRAVESPFSPDEDLEREEGVASPPLFTHPSMMKGPIPKLSFPSLSDNSRVSQIAQMTLNKNKSIPSLSMPSSSAGNRNQQPRPGVPKLTIEPVQSPPVAKRSDWKPNGDVPGATPLPSLSMPKVKEAPKAVHQAVAGIPKLTIERVESPPVFDRTQASSKATHHTKPAPRKGAGTEPLLNLSFATVGDDSLAPEGREKPFAYEEREWEPPPPTKAIKPMGLPKLKLQSNMNVRDGGMFTQEEDDYVAGATGGGGGKGAKALVRSESAPENLAASQPKPKPAIPQLGAGKPKAAIPSLSSIGASPKPKSNPNIPQLGAKKPEIPSLSSLGASKPKQPPPSSASVAGASKKEIPSLSSVGPSKPRGNIPSLSSVGQGGNKKPATAASKPGIPQLGASKGPAGGSHSGGEQPRARPGMVPKLTIEPVMSPPVYKRNTTAKDLSNLTFDTVGSEPEVKPLAGGLGLGEWGSTATIVLDGGSSKPSKGIPKLKLVGNVTAGRDGGMFTQDGTGNAAGDSGEGAGTGSGAGFGSGSGIGMVDWEVGQGVCSASASGKGSGARIELAINLGEGRVERLSPSKLAAKGRSTTDSPVRQLLCGVKGTPQRIKGTPQRTPASGSGKTRFLIQLPGGGGDITFETPGKYGESASSTTSLQGSRPTGGVPGGRMSRDAVEKEPFLLPLTPPRHAQDRQKHEQDHRESNNPAPHAKEASIASQGAGLPVPVDGRMSRSASEATLIESLPGIPEEEEELLPLAPPGATASHAGEQFPPESPPPEEYIPDLDSTERGDGFDVCDLYQGLDPIYLHEREKRLLYSCEELHILVIQMTLSLLLSPHESGVEKLYYAEFPAEAERLNIPWVLKEHLNHKGNTKLVPMLVDRAARMSPGIMRLLKLTIHSLFQHPLYYNRRRMVSGAFGTVYSCRPPHANGELIVKLIDLPKREHDRCLLQELYNEMTILDRFRGNPSVCQLYDYGVNEEYCYMVMKKYKTSLKSWRCRQTTELEQGMLPLYMWTFGRILDAMQLFSDNKVNHFDLKCDNVLIEPTSEDMTDAEFWNSSSGGAPTFSVVLADFGESKIYNSEADEHTYRNRGTEFIMSPEMISIARARYKAGDSYDRRKKSGAGKASDIWSLGCLLYEILTAEFLFYDPLWPAFFVRVTSPDQPILKDCDKEKVGHNEAVIDMLEFMLVRDPQHRPSLKAVRQRFQLLFGDMVASLPTAGFAQRGPDPEAEGVDDSTELRERAEALSRMELITKPSQPRCFGSHFTAEAHEVVPGVWVGKAAGANDPKLGISHAVVIGDRGRFELGHHIKRIYVPASTGGMGRMLDKSCSFIQEALTERGKVLICCDQGVCWSPAVAMAYVMQSKGLKVFEAYVLVRDRYLALRPSAGVFEGLFSWEDSCKAQPTAVVA